MKRKPHLFARTALLLLVVLPRPDAVWCDETAPPATAALASRSAATSAATVIVKAAAVGMPIPAAIYGVNNIWTSVPATEFGSFARAMADVSHYTLIRFPGGWESEAYDWAANDTPGWKKRPKQAGVDPQTLIAETPAQSFVVRSAPGVKGNTPEACDKLAVEAASLVKEYGGAVKMWEIGNEWWLQGFKADSKRLDGLTRYARVVAAVAPAMKAANSSIDIYVNGDWTHPDEFGTLRHLVGEKAWQTVDGLSIHPYCGDVDAASHISTIRGRVAAIRTQAAKTKVYASEWNTTLEATNRKGGLLNANVRVLAFQELVFAGVGAAAMWPPVKVLPRLAFVTADYRQPLAAGQLFGWMAQSYRGVALETAGDIPAAAARNDDGRIVVFVPGMDRGAQTIRLRIDGRPWSKLVSAEVMYDDDDPDQGPAKTAALPVAVEVVDNSKTADFVLNPGGPSRGNNWEIAKIVLE